MKRTAFPRRTPGPRTVVEALEGRLLLSAAPGSLDPTFGGHQGVVVIDVGNFHESSANAVTLLSGGKFAVAGQINGELGVARFNADGSPDPAFGGAGFVATDVNSNGGNAAQALAALPGGKLLAVGQTGVIDTLGDTSVLALARYNADGTPDRSFGGGGVVSTPVGGGPDQAAAVALLPGGKFLVAGTANTDFGAAFILVRYNADGSIDKTFGAAGAAVTHFASGDQADALAVAPGGSIYVAGASGFDPGTSSLLSDTNFALARYTANGALDRSFGTAGVVTTDFDGHNDQADVISLAPDGRITLAGSATRVVFEGRGGDEFFQDFALARYNANGTLDNSFGVKGKKEIQTPAEVVVAAPGGGYLAESNSALAVFNADGSPGKPIAAPALLDNVNALAVQSDGRILEAGATSLGRNPVLGLARLNAGGSADTTFGPPDGTVVSPPGRDARAVAVQPGGAIVVGGSAPSPAGHGDFLLSRYTPAGRPDLAFGGGTGSVITSFGAGTDADLAAVALLPDGRILAAGTVIAPGRGGVFAVARYNADGSPDRTFGNSGRLTTALSPNDIAVALGLLPGGKFVVAGTGVIGRSTGFETVRYDANGTLDTTFGRGGVVLTHFHAVDGGADALAVLPGGKLLEAGHAGAGVGVVRYNADGTLDGSFGGANAGFITSPFLTSRVAAGGLRTAVSLSLAPGGRFVLAGGHPVAPAAPGGIGSAAGEEFGVARFNADGSPDRTFGAKSPTGAGTVATGFVPDAPDDSTGGFAAAVAVRSDGRIVAGGVSTSDGFDSIFTLVRYNPDGSLDSHFGQSGRVLTHFGFDVAPSGIEALALQSDGRILAAGVINDAGAFALARYVG